MTPEPHPRPSCWRCQDWREVLKEGRPKPCPECKDDPKNPANKKRRRSRSR